MKYEPTKQQIVIIAILITIAVCAMMTGCTSAQKKLPETIQTVTNKAAAVSLLAGEAKTKTESVTTDAKAIEAEVKKPTPDIAVIDSKAKVIKANSEAATENLDGIIANAGAVEQGIKEVKTGVAQQAANISKLEDEQNQPFKKYLYGLVALCIIGAVGSVVYSVKTGDMKLGITGFAGCMGVAILAVAFVQYFIEIAIGGVVLILAMLGIAVYLAIKDSEKFKQYFTEVVKGGEKFKKSLSPLYESKAAIIDKFKTAQLIEQNELTKKAVKNITG